MCQKLSGNDGKFSLSEEERVPVDTEKENISVWQIYELLHIRRTHTKNNYK